MAMITGIGTTRYGWQRRPDGTAEATVWIVVLLLPVVPLRAEHVRVVSSGIKPFNLKAMLVALFSGYAEGFQSTIEVLGPARLSLWSILRTYVNGYLVVPIMAMGFALMFLCALLLTCHLLDMDLQDVPRPVMVCFALLNFVWIICFFAWIMDRSAGRHHVYSPPHTDEDALLDDLDDWPND